MANNSLNKSGLKRMAALCEVLGVLLLGNVMARLISDLIGLAGSKQQLNAVPKGVDPNFLKMAWVTAGDLLVKYGILFGLAFSVGWWHRRRRLESYGLSRGGYSVGYLILCGVVLYAISGLLPKLLLFINRFVSLGAGPEHWSVLAGQSSLEFWVFMAVSSFALVPIVEELFVRGYMQTRLTEDFGAGPAIFIIAFIFALSHSQYYRLSVMSLGMLISIILMSLLAGYVFYKTHSLLPVIIAHALGNIPSGVNAETVILVVMVVIALIFWKSVIGYGKGFWEELKNTDDKAGMVVILLLVIIFFVLMVLYFRSFLMIAGIILGLAAFVLEYREKREIRVCLE